MSWLRSLESLYLAAQPLVLNVIGLPVMAYVVRQQGEENYGQWQTAMAITGAMGVLSYLGLRPYFVRAVAQEPASAADRLAEQLVLRLLLATLGGLISMGACLALGHSRVVLLCAAVASFTNLVTAAAFCFADVLEGQERFLAYTNGAFAAGLLLAGASVVVSATGLGPVALSFAYLVGPLASLVVLGLCVHQQTPLRLVWRPARFRALLRECRMQSRANMLGAFEDRAEPIILPKVAGYAPTGIFLAGNIPASRLVQVPFGLASFYFPKLARRQAEGRDLNETVMHMMTLLLVFTLPATLGIIFLSGWISQVLFPKGPELCAQVMRWTSWSLPLAALAHGLLTALQASGQIHETAKVELWTIVLGLAVSLLLVSQWGVFGAILSWLVRAAIAALLLLPLFWRSFGRGFLAVPWGRLALACLAMQASFFAAGRLHLPQALELIGGAVAGSVAFLGLLAATRVLTPGRIGLMLAGGHDPAPEVVRAQ